MRDEILKELLKLSDRQFDPAAKALVNELIGKSDADAKRPLVKLLDKCCYFSWCSDFEIKVLDVLVQQLNVSEAEKAEYRAELSAETH